MTLKLHSSYRVPKGKEKRLLEVRCRVAGGGGPSSALTKAFLVRDLTDVLMSLSNS